MGRKRKSRAAEEGSRGGLVDQPLSVEKVRQQWQAKSESRKSELRTLEDEQLRKKAKIASLQDEIKSLKKRSTRLHTENIAEDKLLMQSIHSFAQASCRELCDKVFKKLPRELRDIIYAYLIPHGVGIAVRRSKSDTKDSPSYFTRPSLSNAGRGHLAVEHYWDPTYVAKNMTREIAEVWYASCHFILKDDDPVLLSMFLEQDRWNMDIVPEKLFRSVEMPVIWELKPNQMMRGGVYASGEDVCADLDLLFRLRKGAKIVLDVRSVERKVFAAFQGLSHRNNSEPDKMDLIHTCEALFPLVPRLHANGYEVEVRFGAKIVGRPEEWGLDIKAWIEKLWWFCVGPIHHSQGFQGRCFLYCSCAPLRTTN
ncbi:hypothetical protein EJ04DRAFT_110093 [Polyplosphaeria fusca]|uniref:Uncharacterized protein n=1 Tax=Polyplosphaeria fusca TaxID=682080 RepID=A0A9P4UWT0_9PLEO|nr:hypothetical protein EJ04DRAFT_110093 [Polyplosphaeria fusca]